MSNPAAVEPEPNGLDFPEYPMRRPREWPFEPARPLRALQAEKPIARVRLWDGSTPWLVTSYEYQRALFADSRLSSDVALPGYPLRGPGGFEQAQMQPENRTIFVMDPPEHTLLRRMLTPPFTVKRLETMRPTVQAIVDGLIDDMLGGPQPIDFVEAFALPVPSLVICELLGVPYAEHEFIHRNSTLSIRADKPEDAIAATERLIEYLEGLVREKLVKPDRGFLSELASTYVRSGELSQREVAVIGNLLLAAGHETTASMIASSTAVLLLKPDALSVLRDTTDLRGITAAVEELLRYMNINHYGQRRVALADIELAETTIRAGEGIIFPVDIADRDSAVLPNPDQLDLQRPARRTHLAFARGPHQCLGQNLVRLELQVVFGTLFRRVPTLKLAIGLDQLRFNWAAPVYKLLDLPVSW